MNHLYSINKLLLFILNDSLNMSSNTMGSKREKRQK